MIRWRINIKYRNEKLQNHGENLRTSNQFSAFKISNFTSHSYCSPFHQYLHDVERFCSKKEAFSFIFYQIYNIRPVSHHNFFFVKLWGAFNIYLFMFHCRFLFAGISIFHNQSPILRILLNEQVFNFNQSSKDTDCHTKETPIYGVTKSNKCQWFFRVLYIKNSLHISQHSIFEREKLFSVNL